MRRKRKAMAAVVIAAAAFAAAGAVPSALAAPAIRPTAHRASPVAFRPGSGQLVVDWNRELIAILGTPGAQPATVHPTRSFAILQAAEYDAVTSITHHGRSYLFSVPAPADARPVVGPGHADPVPYPTTATHVDIPIDIYIALYVQMQR